ncbi:hypothetical protein ACFSQ7_29455 [Paenibacillus rhizoplanae]
MTTIRYTRYLHHAISRPAMLLSALLLCMLPILAGCTNTNSPAASGSPAGTTATSEAGTKSAAQKADDYARLVSQCSPLLFVCGTG